MAACASAQAVPHPDWTVTGHEVYTSAYVHNSPGGVVEEFEATRDRFIKDHTKIEFDGYCYSSCTLLLAVPDKCVDWGTKFGFHSPYINEQQGVRAYTKDDPAKFLSELPPKFQKWVKDHGGLGHHLLVLSGPELYKMVPLCNGQASG